MQILACTSSRNGSMVLCTFSGGPLALLHITHPRLITVNLFQFSFIFGKLNMSMKLDFQLQSILICVIKFV